MNERKRILISSVVIMASAALSVVALAIVILYHTAFEQRREELVGIVKFHARILEAMARFDRAHFPIEGIDHAKTCCGSTRAAAMSKLSAAHEDFPGFGNTGEFTLGFRDGAYILFELSWRHTDDGCDLIPWDGDLAEPMRRALSGKSGTVVALDYRGETVLAAHEPVAVLDLGVVAKFDVAEIRAPFITAGIVTGCVALVVVLVGAGGMLRISSPLIRRMEESEAQSRAIVNTAADGIITINEQGIVESYNNAAAKMFGHNADEVVGRNVSMLMPPPDRDAHNVYIERYSRTGLSTVIGVGREVEGKRKDGSVFPLYINVSDVQVSDRRLFTGIVRDISDAKKAQEELTRRSREIATQNQELEELNQHLNTARTEAESATAAKSAFLANMSHEIRTPMTAILGFAERMRDPELSEADRLADAQTILRNGKYLLGVLNDILDLSKIEAGKLTLERTSCSLVGLIADVTAVMRARAQDKSLSLDAEFPGSIPDRVETDPIRLRQVLINLMGNAVKFTDKGGVRLVTRCIPATGSAADSAEPGGRQSATLQFDIIDTGIGISEEQVASLFQPFSQAETSTTRRFGGTGLGLTITGRLAEMLGGEITVVNPKLGAGAHFRVTLHVGLPTRAQMIDDPAAAATTRDTDAGGVVEDAPPDLRGCRILLAEDGEDNRRLISHILRRVGVDLTVVENGKLAVDAAMAAKEESQPFDVILMDIQMPVLDGREAVSRLRRSGYSWPIMAVTACTMAGDLEKNMASGFDAVATKPIDRRALISAIHDRLNSENARSPVSPQPSAIG